MLSAEMIYSEGLEKVINAQNRYLTCFHVKQLVNLKNQKLGGPN